MIDYMERMLHASLDKRFEDKMSECDVTHHEECELLSGKGECNCGPAVTITCEGKKYSVGEDGEVEPIT